MRQGGRELRSIRRHALVTLVPLVLVALFATGPTALAVHNDGVFELGNVAGDDGSADILASGAQPGPDWGSLFNGSGTPLALPAGGLASAFIADELSQSSETDQTHFAGSNKNNDLIATWQWNTGNEPPKDDLSNVYAYAALDNGDLLLYAGLERLAPEGDSHVDVEFNQAAIGLDKEPPCGSDGVAPPPPAAAGTEPGPPCEFTGEKTVGDILVVMDFTNGGDLGSLEVRRWNGSSYVLKVELSGEGCNALFNGIPADSICAFNNGGDIDGGPWANFDRHGDTITDLPRNAFTEFGVNVTDIFGSVPCVTSLMGKTRTSQSFNSELKDFGGPESFPVCGLAVTKSGDELSKVGDPVDYEITVENTGAVTLFKKSIIDDVLGDLTAGTTAGTNAGVTAVSSTCGASLAPGASCTIDVTYTVQSGDPDPLVNEVTATYNNKADFTGTDVAASDTHSVNLFKPNFTITKTGDNISKNGDDVTYTFTITNTSSSDSPNLDLVSISDTKLGDLSGEAPPACDSLAPGDDCSFQVTHTIPLSNTEDPYSNTVTAVYQVHGFPNQLTREASHEVHLFAPDFTITKTGDALSKVGDEVTYTFTITNTSSSDSPNLDLVSISDTKLGDLSGEAPADCDSLAPGDDCTFQVAHVIPNGASDPYSNTVTAVYQVHGFPNQLTREDSHSVNLFQPGFTISKTGDDFSKVGDQVTYTFTLTNTSSSDSPVLDLVSISDDRLGDLATAATLAGCGELGIGEVCTFSVDHTIPNGAPDPYSNTVTAVYQVHGFPNQLTREDSHSVNLFQPSVEVTKVCEGPSKVGDPVVCTITVTNTSSDDSPDLVGGSIEDSLTGDLLDSNNPAVTGSTCTSTLATTAGVDSCTITTTYTVQATDSDPLVNTVTVEYNPEGFANVVTDTTSESVNLFQPSFTLTKTGAASAEIGDEVTYTFTLTNTSSSDSPSLNLLSITDDKLGDLSAAATAAGCGVLSVGETCTFSVNHVIPADATNPYINTVTAVYQVDGFPNRLTAQDSHRLIIIAVLVVEFLPPTGVDLSGMIGLATSLLLSGAALRLGPRRRRGV